MNGAAASAAREMLELPPSPAEAQMTQIGQLCNTQSHESNGAELKDESCTGSRLHTAAGQNISSRNSSKERRRLQRLRRARVATAQAQQPRQMSRRSVKFYKLFDIPESEVLIKTFPCALKAEILLQGTFYVSANYFCFYARIASMRKIIKIPVRTVCELTREKTAIIFPNAIGIRTNSSRFEFGSIISRDSTFKLLWQLWRAALLPVGEACVQQSSTNCQLVQRLRKSTSDSALTSRSPPAVHPPLACTGIQDEQQQLQLQLQQEQQQQQEQEQPQQLHKVLAESPQPLATCRHRIHRFLLLLSSHVSFLLSDSRLALGSCAVLVCLLLVLYLAYRIHVIQQSISSRLEQLLPSDGRLR